MLDSVHHDFGGDRQLLDLLLACVAIGDELGRWLPVPDQTNTPVEVGHAGLADPVLDCVLGVVAVRETLRRGLHDAGIDPHAGAQPSPPGEPAATRPPLTELMR